MNRRTPTSIVALLPFCSAIACSSPAPPYADLSLRDALGADPSVIAALPLAEQVTIADHFEEQRAAETDADAVPLTAPSTPQEVLRAMDEARRAAGDDALVVAQLHATGGALGVKALPGSAAGQGSPVALPPLEGEPATETADAEARALDGKAGQVLGDVVRATGARRLVRVTQWPTGVVAVDGVAYVNGSWLVAMSALEPRDAGKPRPVLLGVPLQPPVTLTPLTLRGSPFATYPTLASCVADVTARCETCLGGGACDSSATLKDFSSGRSECAFLVDDGGSSQSIEELCLLALTSIDTIAQCVEADGCTPPPGNEDTVAGLPAADAFLGNDTCVRSLNLCLSGQNEPLDGGASTTNIDVDVKGCLGPFEACASAFQALGDACTSDKCSGHGGPSCSSCSGCATCSSCSSDTRTGKGTGYGSAGTGQNPSQGSSSSSSGSASGTSSTSSGGGSTSSGSGTGSGGGSSSGGSGGGSSAGGSSSSGAGGSSGGGSSGGGGGCTGGGSSGAGASSCAACSGGGCSGCSSCAGSSSSSGSGSSSSSSGGGSGCQGCGGGGSGSSSGGGGSGGGGSNCNQCETATANDSAPEPPVSLLWMALPVVYLGRTARRAWRRS
ncbi:MAG TPA: hypothetical protein VHS09_01690 [Polyangiaceae bacterium]|nr:hypothetical protein [Polyangiaceae bacterium]